MAARREEIVLVIERIIRNSLYACRAVDRGTELEELLRRLASVVILVPEFE